MTAIGIRDDRFDFGRVFNRTLEVLKAEWLRFGLFILVVQSVPSMALQGVFVSQGLYGQPNRMLAIMQSPVIGLVGVLGLLIFLLTVAAQAALLWGAGARLADRKATTSEMIATGLRMILPMIGLLIQGMWNAVVTTVSISFSAAVYYELRVAKEGIGPEALAAVFD